MAAKKNATVKKTTAEILEELAKETGDPIAKDLMSIRWHSRNLYDGICIIVNALESQRKQNNELGRSEELLNDFIGELADSFRRFDSESIIDGCKTYSDKLRELLQAEKAE